GRRVRVRQGDFQAHDVATAPTDGEARRATGLYMVAHPVKVSRRQSVTDDQPPLERSPALGGI
ncbi:hypothetical protein, partial [Lichenifustis flavocetrariae]